MSEIGDAVITRGPDGTLAVQWSSEAADRAIITREALDEVIAMHNQHTRIVWRLGYAPGTELCGRAFEFGDRTDLCLLHAGHDGWHSGVGWSRTG